MTGNTVSYSLTGMENVSLDDIRQMLKAPAVAGSSQTFSIVAEKEVPYPAIKALLDTFREAGIQRVQLSVTASPPPLPSPSSATASASMEWRSFGAGVLSTLLVILGFTGLFTLGRWLRRLRQARELRRIASLDG
jgi:hypothetical protein